MIRRSFRRGLTLGLLGGAVVTALRTLQGRRPQPAPAAPASPPTWDRIPDTTPVTVPEPVVEVHTGVEAEAHAADASRQVERPPTDGEPAADRPAAAQTTPPTPTVVEDKPKADPAVNLIQEAPKPKKAPAKKAAKATKKAAKAPAAPWVEPVDGECPGSHPVKGKLTSRIFHVPGGFNYPRTKPDRCYVDAAAAEADGLRLSKR